MGLQIKSRITVGANMVFAAAMLLLLGTSCIKEHPVDGGTPLKPDEAEVVMRLKTPGSFSSSGATRGLTVTQENDIDDIYVLVFDKNNELSDIKQGRDISASGGGAFNVRTFTATFAASRTDLDKYNLVVLANAASVLTATIGTDFGSFSGSKAYADIWPRLTAAITGKMFASGGTIPMWGETGQIVVQAGASANVDLPLHRAIARIDVGVGAPTTVTDATGAKEYEWTNPTGIPFSIDEVYVFRPDDRYSLIPDPANFSTTDPKKATAPTVPTLSAKFAADVSEAKFKFDGVGEITGGLYTTQSIYVPEADIKMGVSGKPGDANHENRMAVIVGGYYDGSTTPSYYRLDFVKDGALLDVLRNHLYQFNIKAVTGPGYPDPETAYKSLALNMTVDIIQWNDGEIEDIIFNGNYMLGVSPLRVELWAIGGTNNQIKVKTDYPQWSYELSDLPTLSDPLSDPTNAEWLTINSHTAGQKYSGTMSGSTIFYDVVHNGTGATRTAYIHITAGRMTMTVAIKQDAYYIDRIYVSPTGNIAPDGEIRTVAIEGFFDNTKVRAWDITNDIQIGTNQTVQAGTSESTSLIIPELWHPSDRTRPNDITIAFEYYNTQQSAWRLIRSDEQTSYFIHVSSNHVPGANIIGIGETFTVEIWGNYPEVRLRAFDGTTSLFGATVPAGTTAQDTPGTENINVPNNPPVALRTVYLQYSVDGGANWINISSGVQQKGQFMLSTGRIVSIANAGSAMDWVTAMGIVGGSTDYNYSWYYSSYGGTADNFTYTPTSLHGCGAYWEGSINDPRTGRGNWRLPTGGELQQMLGEGMIPQGQYWSGQESNATWARAWHDAFGLQDKNKNGALGMYVPRCVRNP